MKQLEDILRRAGEVMLSFRQPKVYTKEGHCNFVTEADTAVQAFLTEALAKAWPEAAFLAEEEEEHRLGSAPTFVVDPIDGTTNFMRQRRASCISVGLVQSGEAVLGGILNPYTGECFLAEKGKGAWLDGERLRVSDVPPERALIALGTSPYDPSLSELTGRCAARVLRDLGDLRRSGSAALDLCEIAAGRCEGSFEWILQPWDYCAGSLLVTEAGGQAGGIEGGAPRFDKGMPFMAASQRCYESLQRLLTEEKAAFTAR